MDLCLSWRPGAVHATLHLPPTWDISTTAGHLCCSDHAAIDSPPMCYFPRAAAVCGSLLGPICILEPQLQALQCCLLRNATKQKNRNIEFLPAWDRRGQTAVALPQTAQNTKSIFLLAENFRGCAVCPAADWSQGQLFEHLSWAYT